MAFPAMLHGMMIILIWMVFSGTFGFHSFFKLVKWAFLLKARTCNNQIRVVILLQTTVRFTDHKSKVKWETHSKRRGWALDIFLYYLYTFSVYMVYCTKTRIQIQSRHCAIYVLSLFMYVNSIFGIYTTE